MIWYIVGALIVGVPIWSHMYMKRVRKREAAQAQARAK